MSDSAYRNRIQQFIMDQLNDENNTIKLIELNLVSFPVEILDLIKESVERLSLQNNNLRALPSNFNKLSKLRYLDLHGNNFSDFPLILTTLPNLEILDLSENSLRRLPANPGTLVNLKVLSLKNNNFEYLPTNLVEFENLKILEVNNNPLIMPSLTYIHKLQSEPDDWIVELKKFLEENSHFIDGKIQDDPVPAFSDDTAIHPTAVVERSRSISEPVKSTRASKRMGLIIKRSEDPEAFSSNSQTSQSGNSIIIPPINQIPSSQPPSVVPPPIPSGPPPPIPSSQSQPPVLFTPQPQSLPQPIQQTQPQQQQISQPQVSRSRSSTLTRELDKILEKNGNVDTEHKSGAYFRRLSTLQEAEHSLSSFKIVELSRKMLFTFSELHSSIRRFIGFSSDKKLAIKMVQLLYNAKAQIDNLVESLESIEEKINTTVIDEILNIVVNTINSFKMIMTLLKENLSSFTDKTDVCFIRMLLLTIFGSMNELLNAYRILNPNERIVISSQATQTFKPPQSQQLSLSHIMTQQSTHSQSQLSQQQPSLTINTNVSALDSEEVDEKLYECINTATSCAQVVFGELTQAIAKSAMQSAHNSNNHNDTSQINHIAASKVKELTNVCVSTMDITKRLKGRLVTIRNDNLMDKKKFWEDTNAFLKAIINILSTSKSAMKDLPILNEVRPSMAALTKATKDVTIMLEVSSYRYMANEISSGSMSANPSSSNIPVSLSAIPSVSNFTNPTLRTPLAATLGPAAQAIMPTPPIGSTISLASPLVAHPNPLTSPPSHLNPFDGLIMNGRS